MTSDLTLEERARYRWIVGQGARAVLHAPRLVRTVGGLGTALDEVETVCGQVIRSPGFLRPWRWSVVKRCARCCGRLLLPTGAGEPARDRECRIAAGWPPDLEERL